MVSLAQGLPVVLIPEETLIPTMRNDVIHHCRLGVYLPKFTGRKETVLPHIFTQEELMAFFEKVDGYIPHTTRRDDRRMGNEYRMLFRLLYCCGLRNSEGCGIAKDQVDLDMLSLPIWMTTQKIFSLFQRNATRLKTVFGS